MLNNTTTEQRLIASIIHQYDDDLCKGLGLLAVSECSEDYFTTKHHTAVFRAIKAVLRDGGTPNAIRVESELHGDTTGFIWEIASVATSQKIDWMINDLRDLHVSRRLHAVSLQAVQELQGSQKAGDSVQKCESMFMSAMASGRKVAKNEGYLKDYVREYWAETESMMSRPDETGIPSGIGPIDDILNGFRGGDIVVVAGRTGMGKSSLVATMVAKQIMRGYKPAVFSFELGRKEIVDKLFSMLSEFDKNGAEVPFRNIYNPRQSHKSVGLSSSQLQRLAYISTEYLNDSNCFLRGASSSTVEEVMSICRRLKSEGNLSMPYIDHIGLLVRDKNNAVSELTHITNSLKMFACEEDIPVCEVVQLSRNADTAKEKPRLSHMKGSGSIEEDANIILMPWRPYAIDKSTPPTECEIILAKSRNSECGEIPAFFSTSTTSFTPLSEMQEGQERF